jgi:hypothetical protein
MNTKMHSSRAVAIWIREELRKSPKAMAFADALEAFAEQEAAMNDKQCKAARAALYTQWYALTDAERAKIEDIELDVGPW